MKRYSEEDNPLIEAALEKGLLRMVIWNVFSWIFKIAGYLIMLIVALSDPSGKLVIFLIGIALVKIANFPSDYLQLRSIDKAFGSVGKRLAKIEETLKMKDVKDDQDER